MAWEVSEDWKLMQKLFVLLEVLFVTCSGQVLLCSRS